MYFRKLFQREFAPKKTLKRIFNDLSKGKKDKWYFIPPTVKSKQRKCEFYQNEETDLKPNLFYKQSICQLNHETLYLLVSQKLNHVWGKKKKGTISLYSSTVLFCSFYHYVSLLINDFSAGIKPSIPFQHSTHHFLLFSVLLPHGHGSY